MATGYKVNIEKKTLNNSNYRKVLFTTPQMQLVVMNIKKNQDIPKEKHSKTTQFIRIEKGDAMVEIGNSKYYLKDNDSIIIPAGTWHYVKNTGTTTLKLYTIYSPPEHPDGLTQKNKK